MREDTIRVKPTRLLPHPWLEHCSVLVTVGVLFLYVLSTAHAAGRRRPTGLARMSERALPTRRVRHACAECRKRKVKCNLMAQGVCEECHVRDVACVFTRPSRPATTTTSRTRHLEEELREIRERVTRLEQDRHLSRVPVSSPQRSNGAANTGQEHLSPAALTAGSDDGTLSGEYDGWSLPGSPVSVQPDHASQHPLDESRQRRSPDAEPSNNIQPVLRQLQLLQDLLQTRTGG